MLTYPKGLFVTVFFGCVGGVTLDNFPLVWSHL